METFLVNSGVNTRHIWEHGFLSTMLCRTTCHVLLPSLLKPRSVAGFSLLYIHYTHIPFTVWRIFLYCLLYFEQRCLQVIDKDVSARRLHPTQCPICSRAGVSALRTPLHLRAIPSHRCYLVRVTRAPPHRLLFVLQCWRVPLFVCTCVKAFFLSPHVVSALFVSTGCCELDKIGENCRRGLFTVHSFVFFFFSQVLSSAPSVTSKDF